MDILVVVDCQNDYITGKLGRRETEEIIPAIKQRVFTARENREMVIFTQDTHDEEYSCSLESQAFPEHCIYGTTGWEICPDLKEYAALSIYKPTFGSFDLVNRIKSFAAAFNETPTIELCGIWTDTSIISNALILRAAFPNAIININSNLCIGNTLETHEAALEVMKLCQINIIE